MPMGLQEEQGSTVRGGVQKANRSLYMAEHNAVKRRNSREQERSVYYVRGKKEFFGVDW